MFIFRFPPTISEQIHRPTNALHFAADGFHTKKLCSRHPSREVHFKTENVFFEPSEFRDDVVERTLFILGSLEKA